MSGFNNLEELIYSQKGHQYYYLLTEFKILESYLQNQKQKTDNQTSSTGQLHFQGVNTRKFFQDEEKQSIEDQRISELKHLKSLMDKLQKVKRKLLQDREMTNLMEFFEDVKKDIIQTRLIPVYLKFVFFQGAAYETLGNIEKAINIWKNSLKYCNHFKHYLGKMMPYKMLTILNIKLKNYENSFLYIKKLLFLAWKTKDTELELLCYDLISKIYYSMQDIEMSNYFYKKMIIGQLEPDNSGTKRIGITIYDESIKSHNLKADDDSFDQVEFDMMTFKNQSYLNKKNNKVNEYEIMRQQDDQTIQKGLQKIDRMALKKMKPIGVVRTSIKKSYDGEWEFKPQPYQKERFNSDKINLTHLSKTRNYNDTSEIGFINPQLDNNYLSYRNAVIQDKQIIFPLLLYLLQKIINFVEQTYDNLEKYIDSQNLLQDSTKKQQEKQQIQILLNQKSLIE